MDQVALCKRCRPAGQARGRLRFAATSTALGLLFFHRDERLLELPILILSDSPCLPDETTRMSGRQSALESRFVAVAMILDGEFCVLCRD
jgi:hypothetical protein